MCLGHLGEQVQSHCGDGSRYGMELCYSFDGEKLMGTGGARIIDAVLNNAGAISVAIDLQLNRNASSTRTWTSIMPPSSTLSSGATHSA